MTILNIYETLHLPLLCIFFFLAILLFSSSFVEYKFQYMFSMIKSLMILWNNFSDLSVTFVYIVNFPQIF